MDVEISPLEDAQELFRRLGNNPSEALVNGVWLHVLKRLFPQPRFLIAPEYWTDTRRPGGSRVDLVVYRVENFRPVFVYEGKRNTEDLSLRENDAFAAILSAGLRENLDQIKRYLNTLARGQGEVSYGVLAQGTQFTIMCYDGANFYRVAESSLAVDERFNVFRDFAGVRFDRDQADKILDNIAMKYR